MSYPPQQPENGWSDQQQEPVDPFAQGNAAPPAAPQQPGDVYGQQAPQQQGQQPPVYQAQPPVYYPAQQPGYPPSDQTQALPPRASYDAPVAEPFQAAQPYPPQAPDPSAQQYYQPDEPDTDQQPAYQQPPVDPNAQQQYYQPADPNAQQQYYQPADPNAMQQQAYPQADPNAQQQQYYQPADPNLAAQQGYPQAQPLPDPFAQQQPEQPFPQAPVSASPTSAQPASGQPFSAQPYSPAAAGAATPPGVPESPFAAAPTHNPMNLPAPVSAQPSSGQPWNTSSAPYFTPRKPKRGIPGWVYVVGVIVIVAALAVGGVVWMGIGSGDNPKEQTSASEKNPTDKPTEKEKPTLIEDDGSGLAYMSLPKPWEDVSSDKLAGFTQATGQIHKTDTGVSGYFLTGELDAKAVKYKNVDNVASSTNVLAELIDGKHWVDDKGKKLKGVERDGEPKLADLRIDGHRAFYMTYKVTWKSKEVEEKSAEVVVGVVDMEDKKAAGFFAVVPESLSDKQKPAVEDTILTLRFE